jgi:hypothetical protein
VQNRCPDGVYAGYPQVNTGGAMKMRVVPLSIPSYYRIAYKFDELQTSNDCFQLPATKLRGDPSNEAQVVD